MSSSQLELKVSQLFKAILDGEKQLEPYKQCLIDQPNFDPYLTFNLLDQTSQGYISPSMVANFLKKHGIELLQVDLIIFFNSHDYSGECQLTYSNFLNIIVPRNGSSFYQPSISRDSCRTPNKKRAFVSYEVERALARVLDKQISFTKKMDLIKKSITKREDFTLAQIFNSIDLDNTGMIDIDALYLFLKKNRITASEDDTVVLFRSMDQDNDDQLSYTEFIRSILPASLIAQKSHTSKPHISNYSSRRTSTPQASHSRPPKLSVAFSHQRQPSVDAYSNRRSQTPSMHSRRYSISDKCHEYATSNNRENNNITMYRDKSLPASPSFARQKRDLYQENTVKGYRDEVSEISVSRSGIPRNLSSSRDWSANPPMKRNRIDTHNKEWKVEQSVMLEEDGERDLASVFKELINLDRETESSKNELALREDFNIVDIFRLFDIEAKGFIDKHELGDGLAMFKIFPTEKEINLLMKRHDRDHDDILKCSDFCNMLTPIHGEYARMLKNKIMYNKAGKRVPETLSKETTFLLRKTLQTIISNESYCECLRHRLHSKKGFSLYKAFKTIDNRKNGFINMEDIKFLMDSNGLCASQKELSQLMYRFDRKQNGRTTYNEFVEEMKPKVLLTEEF